MVVSLPIDSSLRSGAVIGTPAVSSRTTPPASTVVSQLIRRLRDCHEDASTTEYGVCRRERGRLGPGRGAKSRRPLLGRGRLVDCGAVARVHIGFHVNVTALAASPPRRRGRASCRRRGRVASRPVTHHRGGGGQGAGMALPSAAAIAAASATADQAPPAEQGAAPADARDTSAAADRGRPRLCSCRHPSPRFRRQRAAATLPVTCDAVAGAAGRPSSRVGPSRSSSGGCPTTWGRGALEGSTSTPPASHSLVRHPPQLRGRAAGGGDGRGARTAAATAGPPWAARWG